ncbi:MAG: glutamine-hydrolyzing GMP synthase [candidate division WOR-3 bacterium]
MDKIIIIDFGSQYTKLIARRIREENVYSEIISPYEDYIEKIKSKDVKGVILSGGPMSVYEKRAPKINREIFDLGKPILGICYGLQLISYILNGKVRASEKREYGFAKFKILRKSPLFDGINTSFLKVWMSHGDTVSKIPEGFIKTGETEACVYASIENKKKKIYGLQFHPEVFHTEHGKDILKNFVFKICKAKKGWFIEDFIEKTREELKKYEDKECFLALSGGVDSTVLAFLLHPVFKNKLHLIFVNTGLLREGEEERVKKIFKEFENLRIIRAENEFLNRLKGIENPELKRKIIGKLFMDIFIKEALKILNIKRPYGKIAYLAQGTLYPDVIESRSFVGPSSKIKTHHNVGALPKKHPFILIEPFKELFKDEVREIGKRLGLPDEVIKKHPFPGPGLAVRIIGEVTRERVRILQKADKILEEELKKEGIYENLWQAFCVFLPVKSVGVMGDKRTYENSLALRIVESVDGMTADFARIPFHVLDRIARRIVGEIKGINRVVYDITSKPPATIEWE